MFHQVVELYRKLGKPPVEQGGFSYEGTVSEELITLLNAMGGLPEHFGVFSVRNITGSTVDIEFSLPGSEYGRFHSSLSEFLKASPSLEFGVVPSQYYICDIDFYSHDENIPSEIRNLTECCEFIKLLSVLASENTSDSSVGGVNKLVFVLAADGKSPSKTFTVRTKIDREILDKPIPHLNLLRALISDSRRDLIHVEERRIILQIAIAEVLSTAEEGGNNFTHLARQWKEVLRKYRHNFQAFLHQYSFEKIRKEIASAEIDHATKLSGVLGDIAGKLLALPVSLGAIILLRGAKTLEEFIVIAIGLCVVTIVFIGVLLNQWLQVDRLRGSFNIIFGQYDEKLDSFPKRLRAPVIDAKKKIRKQGFVLSITFVAFGFIALLPLFGTIYVTHDKYGSQIITYAQHIIALLVSYF